MLSKPWKTIVLENGKVDIYGNNHTKELEYGVPEWNEEEEEYFTYKGEKYFLSEFMRVERYAPEWMKEFDGYSNDSFFSGILVKFVSGDYNETMVKVYTYIC